VAQKVQLIQNRQSEKAAVGKYDCRFIHYADVRLHANMKGQVIWAKLMRRATALAVPIRRLSWFNSIHF